MKKFCPKCQREYTELENYCTKCGMILERQKNVCSENKTSMCGHRVYEDDDMYCAYCGSLTTYALDKKNKE